MCLGNFCLRTLFEYQSAIVREDMEAVEEILLTLRKEQRSKVTRFLEAWGASLRIIELNRKTDSFASV